MGLFDKKYCDVCGEKIRFLGNRKLEDGNLCKDCAEKLSPWFSDRRRSTVSEIKAQLAYREENKEKVAAFRCSRTLGESSLVCIDDEKGQFLIRRGGESLGNNPDVLALDDVQDCRVDIEESKREEKHLNEEKKQVSFEPPRFTYSYGFYVEISVNHPYFDDMRFRVNRSSVEIQTGMPIQTSGLLAAAKLFTPDVPDTAHCEAYQKYLAMAEEIRRALLRLPGEEDDVPEAPKPHVYTEKVACPCCTAVAVPDQNGCCPYCGEKVV